MLSLMTLLLYMMNEVSDASVPFRSDQKCSFGVNLPIIHAVLCFARSQSIFAGLLSD